MSTDHSGYSNFPPNSMNLIDRIFHCTEALSSLLLKLPGPASHQHCERRKHVGVFLTWLAVSQTFVIQNTGFPGNLSSGLWFRKECSALFSYMLPRSKTSAMGQNPQVSHSLNKLTLNLYDGMLLSKCITHRLIMPQLPPCPSKILVYLAK